MKTSYRYQWIAGVIMRGLILPSMLIIVSGAILGAANASDAQNVNPSEVFITLHLEEADLMDAFEKIERETDFRFAFNYDSIDLDKPVTIRAEEESVEQILHRLLEGTGITWGLAGRVILLRSWNNPEESEAGYDYLFQEVTGRVTDAQSGEPLPGVNVVVAGSEEATGSVVGTQTDADGFFAIHLPEGLNRLQFTSVGYQPVTVTVDEETEITVEMTEDILMLEDLVVVGYGTQDRVTLSGSVASVRAEEIVKTKNENIQNALTGKIPGVRVHQKTSEPGVFSNDFDIRGFGTPLIVIDGVPRPEMSMHRLNSNDIESISVLKDASAAVYGVRAANGVILVTTKQGEQGALELNYSTTYSVQTPSGLPNTVDAIDWYTLSNEKFLREQGITYEGSVPYSQELIDEYRNGSRQSYDWYSYVIQNRAPQAEHNISATGGFENVNYFISLGYLNQEGFFESGDMMYERYNVRSNITARLTDFIKADLKISGIMDQRNKPHIGTWEVFKALWRQNPIDPPYANNNSEYLRLMESGTNPIAISSRDISGYQTRYDRVWQGSFSLSYEPQFVEGLELKGMYSYDYRTGNTKTYQREFDLYTYDESTDSYHPNRANAPSRVRRHVSEYPLNLLQTSLAYTQSFLGVHNVNVLLLYEEQTRTGDSFYAQRDLALTGLDELFAGSASSQIGSMSASSRYKLTNKGFVGKFNYDYDRKYMAEFSFRYDGSSKFPAHSRWGFFPSGSVAWRISKENFFENAHMLRFISDLKIRASYGIMGDDAASAFQHITGYTYPGSRGGNNQGLQGGAIFDGSFISAVEFRNLPNPNITWFEAKTLNFGLDTELWDGRLGFEVDLFQRNREGLLATRRLSLPGTLGASLPEENMNSDQVRGYEIAVSHRNVIGELGYRLTGNFSYTRTRWLEFDQANATNSYDHWRNQRSHRYNDLLWGYEVVGQFEDYDEIYTSDVYYGTQTLPGDVKYLDWNGDGVIDGNDIHPIANNNSTPKIYFGFTADLNYRSFDASILLQGASMVNVNYPEQLRQPLVWNGSALDYFTDRWHPEDPTANPYDPGTTWIEGKYPYTGATATASSTFHLQDASYLRLKTLEVGYTLPDLTRIGIRRGRIFMNGYNLLTWSGIDYVDPERPEDTYGYVYPVNRTFNFGIDITF